MSNFSFSPQCFPCFLRTFCHFLSNLKLSSANSFSLEESKICRLGKGWNKFHHLSHIWFLAPLALGQRAYVMVRCPSFCASVRALTFSLNIFSETTYRILMKFHWNVPAMVLLRISWKNLILSKTVVAMATKLKNFENLLVRNHKG